jgi:ABC-type multidrug transport system permease subunit
MFSIFMLLTLFNNMAQQIMPLFVGQRALYEARERPSKAYSWKAFLGAQILVELPWQTLMAVVTFCSWYYPVGLYRNAVPTGTVTERGGLMFLLIWSFYLFTSTFTHLIIAAVELADVGGMYANLCFSLSLIFCGYASSLSHMFSGLTFVSQCPCYTIDSSQILDLHVPLVALHLPRICHAFHRSCEHRTRLFLHRTVYLRSTKRTDMWRVHEQLYFVSGGRGI